jgi:hypothetical protein
LRSPSVADTWHTHCDSHYVTNKRLREGDQETGVYILLFLLCPILLPARRSGNVILLQNLTITLSLGVTSSAGCSVSTKGSAIRFCDRGLGSVTGHCLWALSGKSGTRSGLFLLSCQYSLVSITPTMLQMLYNISN